MNFGFTKVWLMQFWCLWKFGLMTMLFRDFVFRRCFEVGGLSGRSLSRLGGSLPISARRKPLAFCPVNPPVRFHWRNTIFVFNICHALPYPAPSYLTLPSPPPRPCSTLPCPALPFPTLRYLALPYLALPCISFHFFALSHVSLPCLAFTSFTLSLYLTLPYPTLPYATLTLLADLRFPYLTLLSRLVPCLLPHPTLPYPTLPYPDLT